MKGKNLIYSAVFFTLILWSASAFSADVTDFIVRPNQITIGTGYNGTTVTISGTIPEDSIAVIRLLGEREDKTFKKKGKAFGVLWMNMSSITLHNVPGVFLLALDADTYADGGEAWKALGLGFQSFQGKTDSLIYDEFVKLKEREGLYEIQEGGITYGQAKDGLKTFSAELSVPSALRKGIYDAQVFAVRNGAVVAKADHEVHAVLDGFPALLSTMAYDHSLFYGIAATIVAILAGLLMTVVFKDKGGAH
ncbi:TIGR02186 family protein [Desulfovibrio inopinatus]|uniref:TIGR02186 family protein n=1 Tax=Desulfovibrio inopinatus TaxID=102109 RepID=UPI0003F65E67|nr:TIGR02186 family protein [Desulfovibrio inopinatus]